MKILLVIPSLGSVYGGPPKCVVELAQALGYQGVNVDVVATNVNGFEDIDVPLQTWIAEKGYRVQYFPYWKIGTHKIRLALTRWPISAALTQWLFKHIRDYDLVHTNTIFSYPILVAHWACRFHQVPYLVTPHGMLNPWALAYKAQKKRIYFHLLEKPTLQGASALQVLNSIEAKNVDVLNLNVPLSIVPNGIHRQDFEVLPDRELFYQKFPETRSKTLILFLARIDPLKGLDLLATAFAKVNALFPETHLVVAGSDNNGFLPTAQEYFVQAGCADSVTFTGMLAGSVKYAALASASIYVSPSYLEGFSMSVLEGMASGLPCVITSACNFPEAAAAQAACIVEVDAEAIANALIQQLSHPDQAKEMGDRARQFILKHYTWEKSAAILIDTYTQIIEKKLPLRPMMNEL